MTNERAIEILDPEHREQYDSIETVNEACRIGMNAIKRVQALEAENAELRDRLSRAVELPRVECIMTREWLSRELIGAIMFEWCVLYKKGSYLMAEPCLSKGAAEIRLAELKGEKKNG